MWPGSAVECPVNVDGDRVAVNYRQGVNTMLVKCFDHNQVYAPWFPSILDILGPFLPPGNSIIFRAGKLVTRRQVVCWDLAVLMEKRLNISGIVPGPSFRKVSIIRRE